MKRERAPSLGQLRVVLSATTTTRQSAAHESESVLEALLRRTHVAFITMPDMVGRKVPQFRTGSSRDGRKFALRGKISHCSGAVRWRSAPVLPSRFALRGLCDRTARGQCDVSPCTARGQCVSLGWCVTLKKCCSDLQILQFSVAVPDGCTVRFKEGSMDKLKQGIKSCAKGDTSREPPTDARRWRRGCAAGGPRIPGRPPITL